MLRLAIWRGLSVVSVVVALVGCGASLPPIPTTIANTVALQPGDQAVVLGPSIEAGPAGVTVNGSIATPFQHVRITVLVTEPTVLRAYVDGYDRLDPTLALLDNAEGQIVFNDDARNLNPQINVGVAPGRYTLDLASYANPRRPQSSSGPFRLMVWTTPE